MSHKKCSENYNEFNVNFGSTPAQHCARGMRFGVCAQELDVVIQTDDLSRQVVKQQLKRLTGLNLEGVNEYFYNTTELEPVTDHANDGASDEQDMSIIA